MFLCQHSHCKSMSQGERPSICNEYTTHAMEIDKFMFEKEDFLVVTAAGDTGNQEKEATVASPSTCKNCLTVGATNIWNQRYRDAAAVRDPMEDVCSACSIPHSCSESEFIFGASANTTSRPGLLNKLPACCNSTVQIEHIVEETVSQAILFHFILFCVCRMDYGGTFASISFSALTGLDCSISLRRRLGVWLFQMSQYSIPISRPSSEILMIGACVDRA